MLVSMVSEVRLVLNLKKALFYFVFEAHVYSPGDALLGIHSTLPNVGLMLGHRLRRCPSIKPRLAEYRPIMCSGLVYFTAVPGPLSPEFHQPLMSLRHGAYVILLPEGQFSWLICAIGDLCSLVIHVTVN